MDIDFSAVNTLSNLLELNLSLARINLETLQLVDFSSLTKLHLYCCIRHQEPDIGQQSKVVKYIALQSAYLIELKLYGFLGLDLEFYLTLQNTATKLILLSTSSEDISMISLKNSKNNIVYFDNLYPFDEGGHYVNWKRPP